MNKLYEFKGYDFAGYSERMNSLWQGMVDARAVLVEKKNVEAERIPEIAEERLYAMAKSNDELAEKLRSLQAWIKESGLY